MENKPYKEITSGGHKYQVYPIKGRAACHLDRKVTDIAYSFRSVASDKNDLGLRILHAFAEMEDYKFDEIVESTLGNVVRIGDIEKGESNIRLTIENVYDYFVGDIDGFYGLLVQIWEAYELTPFAKAKTLSTGS
jgi:hypothetical protein